MTERAEYRTQRPQTNEMKTDETMLTEETRHCSRPTGSAGKPVRTCVACRQQGTRADTLVRLVKGPGGAIAVDVRARLGGRGAWVHPTRSCLTTAARRHAAERALEIPVQPIDPATLVTGVIQALRRKALSLLITARRTRTLAIGNTATVEAMEKGEASLVLVAHDAGEASKSLGEEAKDNGGVPTRTFGSKVELGSVLGREQVAVLAVTDPRIAKELVSTIDRIAGLEG